MRNQTLTLFLFDEIESKTIAFLRADFHLFFRWKELSTSGLTSNLRGWFWNCYCIFSLVENALLQCRFFLAFLRGLDAFETAYYIL